MKRFSLLLAAAAASFPLCGCTPESADAAPRENGGAASPAAAALDGPADGYVRLALALGRHERAVVDAYYGPEDRMKEAGEGDKTPLPELLARARALLAEVRAAGPSDRRTFLTAQLVALETDLRRRGGERFTLFEEARLLFDVTPTYTTPERLAEVHERLEALLPGKGDLRTRLEALRERFTIPPDRIEDVARAVLGESHRRTSALVDLPAGEGVALRQVRDQPWGAYNWYLGGLKSRIELNVGLPLHLSGLARTLVHEGYPGHHAFHALLEDGLVRKRGWIELTIYPLWSPQSLVAEGTAEAAWDTIFPGDEGRTFLRDVLAPAAGLTGPEHLETIGTYLEAEELQRELRGAQALAARMLLDENRSEDEVRRFLMRDALLDREHADRAIAFIRAYRAYVFTYPVGEEVVERAIGIGPDRAQRFFDILRKATTPGELEGRATAP